MFLSPSEPADLLPGDQTVAWAYQVSLGLIGTFYTGYILAPADLSTPIGKAATGFLLFAIAVAFTGAFLTAAEIDESSDGQEDPDEIEAVEQSPPIDAIADGGSYDEEEER